MHGLTQNESSEEQRDEALSPIYFERYESKAPPRPILEEQALSRPMELSSMQSALFFLALFTIASVFAWQNPHGILVATQRLVFESGEWWRLITSPFVHADFIHLLSNSMLFLVFASLLNNYFGRWAFPILSVLGAAATEAIALLTYPPDLRLVGASGMVYLMAGMWLIYFLRHSSYLPLSHRIMRVIAFSFIVLLPSTIEEQVSYRSHGIGFGLGLAIAFVSLPWLKPIPLSPEAYARAQYLAKKKRQFLEEDDDVLTYLALRDQPRRQSPLGDLEQLTNPSQPIPRDESLASNERPLDNK